ncbi:Telomeric repeat-binding factor 2 [Corynebacterium segmentosum]|uniref:Telomeric repeat-binding factor 2 n=2 Tax=Corynebacterium segmentosum TaxID=43990 RepID=A0ABY6TA90_9CORY|nr:Telomeric repeat-binding factor 2 [Corynebacterium segmentosum]
MPQQPQKKKRGCMKWGFIIIGVLILIMIISAIFSSDETDNSSSSDDSSNSAASNEDGNQEAPAKEDSTEFAPGETYSTKDGLEMTINGMHFATDVFDDTYLAAEVTYVNNSDDEKSFNPIDWSVQTPSGVVADYDINGFDDSLHAGKLTPGGTVTGTLYFEHSEPGEYRVIWKPTFSFSSDTATWVSTL